MTVVTKKLTLGDFTVESLGVDWPDYFQGYGLGPKSDYSDCCYGIGDTEAEALEDCLEMMAQSGRIDLDDDAEKRIREDYGHCDDTVTAAEEAGCEDEGDDADCDGRDGPYWHVGIKWNVREEQRLQRVRKIPNLSPLRYEDYCAVEKDSSGYSKRWGHVKRADGSASYGDFKDSDWPESAESYFSGLSDDCEESNECYFYVPVASGSDYSGSTVEKANAKWFEDTFGSNEWVHSVYGGYDTYAVAVGLTGLLGCDDETFDAVCEALEGLDNYPVFDDEVLSTLEMEGADEAWESWVKGDFERALCKRFADCEECAGEVEFDFSDDSAVRTMFEKAADSANEYWFNEGYGPDMYIRIDKIVEGIDLDTLDAFVVKWEVSWVDVGAESEVYYSEADAIAKVASLCAAGIIGAGYAEVKPVKSDTASKSE